MSMISDRLKYGIETVKDPLYDNKHSFGKININEELCNCCGDCIKECIVDAIACKNDKIFIDNKKCVYCGNCIDICKNKALVNSHDYKMAEFEENGALLKEKIYKEFKHSLVLRSVDTGSCNACMSELSAVQNNYYSISRFGVNFAASPRHADGIVVTGPVTINMKEALIKTYKAIPEPKIVIAMGTCAYDGGVFKDAYGTVNTLKEIIPVSLVIPGCPPSPQAIIYGILKLMDRL